MNAAERPRTPLSILGVIQLRTSGEEALVRNAVVSGQHLKMRHQVHPHELTSDHNRRTVSRSGKDGRVAVPNAGAAYCKSPGTRRYIRAQPRVGASERVGGDPGFMRSLSSLAARDNRRFGALAAVAGEPSAARPRIGSDDRELPRLQAEIPSRGQRQSRCGGLLPTYSPRERLHGMDLRSGYPDRIREPSVCGE
jgi:hypothetical protein